MKILKPFGPAVGMFKLDDIPFEALNTDCEYVTKASNFSKYDFSKGLIGQIQLQARFSDETLEAFGKYFIDIAEKFVKEVFNIEASLKIQDAWYNRIRRPKEYNPEHIHPQSLITSVGYLALPKGFEKLKDEDTEIGRGGGLELFHGEALNFCFTKNTIIPVVKDFFVFPAYLRHAVHPMPKSITGERRSFSINFINTSE